MVRVTLSCPLLLLLRILSDTGTRSPGFRRKLPTPEPGAGAVWQTQDHHVGGGVAGIQRLKSRRCRDRSPGLVHPGCPETPTVTGQRPEAELTKPAGRGEPRFSQSRPEGTPAQAGGGSQVSVWVWGSCLKFHLFKRVRGRERQAEQGLYPLLALGFG